MKVVHLLKRIESIEQDVKELKKLEKSIASNKSFSTPIYMSIEKQINILLGEKIKMLELRIENPPEYLVEEIEGTPEEAIPSPESIQKPKTKTRAKAPAKKTAPQKTLKKLPDGEIPMLTQDQIDAKFDSLKTDNAEIIPETPEKEISDKENNDAVKLLDIALEKGTLRKKNSEKDKEKKVRFFRENFPVE